MKTKFRIPTVLFLALFALLPATLFAQGTAFTYQGSLNDGANRANGVYDLQFSIYSAGSGPGLIAGPITNSATAVSNGLFTVNLDFGASPFNGAPCWLEISVRSNGLASFTTLTPRQQLTPTPYAITASNLTGTLPAAQLTGPLPSSQLSGTYNGIVNFNNASDQFSGNGAGLTGVNAASLGGLGPNAFWQTTGNSNIVDGLNYLGTADYNPFDLRVNNTRGLRVEPDPRGLFAANLIGGYSNNAVQQPGSGGNTIAGGGAPGIPNLVLSNSAGVFIGAGSANIIGPGVVDSVIAGGFGSSNLSSDSVIAGGNYNGIQANSGFSVIGGGQNNAIGTNAFYSIVAGGGVNFIGPGAAYSVISGGILNSNLITDAVIVGGFQNLVTTNQHGFYTPNGSFIGAGSYNVANNGWTVIGGGYLNTNNGVFGIIGGGEENTVNGDYSAIAGGFDNESGGAGSFVGGGGFNGSGYLGNRADGNASSVLGGWGNVIQGNAPYSIIAGGDQNLIQSNASYSVIVGGITNVMSGAQSFIGGGYLNSIGSNSFNSFLAGGYSNNIGFASSDTVLAGGAYNYISNSTIYGTILGGDGNIVSGTWGTILGGYSNTVAGQLSLAAGDRAKAVTSGTFVWADAEGPDFVSTSPNQFLIRAAGGVGINKNNPSTALDVAGTVTATAFNGSFNAGNLTGTLPNSVLNGLYSNPLTLSNPGNTFVGNGGGLFALNAGNINVGALPDTVLSGTYSSQLNFINPLNFISGNGSSLTQLNAANITTGTLDDNRLAGDVALITRNPQSFTGSNYFYNSIIMADPTKTIQFPFTSGSNVPMIEMFPGGTGNADRMVIAHSATYTNWGLQYQDGPDRFQFIGGGNNAMCVDLNLLRVGVRVSAPTDVFVVVNAHCDGSTWMNASDRNLKEHFTPIDPEQILAKVASLPVTEWNYKNNTAQHLGPVAQDFYSEFSLGTDDKSISTVDEGGVALAAIQGLNKKVEEQAAQLKDRDARIAALEKAVTELREIVKGSSAESRGNEP